MRPFVVTDYKIFAELRHEDEQLTTPRDSPQALNRTHYDLTAAYETFPKRLRENTWRLAEAVAQRDLNACN
jgi:hypothetical protein